MTIKVAGEAAFTVVWRDRESSEIALICSLSIVCYNATVSYPDQ